LSDVLEGRPALDAYGVVGELLALDVLLDADLGDAAHHSEHALELGAIADAVGVRATGPRDGLHDQRVVDLLGRGAHVVGREGACGAWRANAGGAGALLHDFLVAKAAHRVDAHAGDPPALAELRGEDDERLPVRPHAIDALASERGRRTFDDVVFVHDARHRDVVGKVPLHRLRKPLARRVPHANHLRADLGKAAAVLDHLGGIARGEEENAHRRKTLAKLATAKA